MEAAANGIVAGIFAATGQTCMAGSRLIVQEGLHDELVERLTEKATPSSSATRWTREHDQCDRGEIAGLVDGYGRAVPLAVRPDMRRRGHRRTARPAKVDDKLVAVDEYRDGVLIDVVRQATESARRKAV